MDLYFGVHGFTFGLKRMNKKRNFKNRFKTIIDYKNENTFS